MRRQRDIFQSREEDKISEKELTEIEIINIPNKEFKVMVKKMLTGLGGRVDKL